MKRPTTEERFWKRVEKNGPVPAHCPELGPCWIWTGGIQSNGYGTFHLDKTAGYKNVRAHRFSYELEYGPLSEGVPVLHKCDNPPCVNPHHLKSGTLAENSQEISAKARRANHYVNLSPEIALEIKRLYASGQYSQRALAEKFDIPSHTSVGRIIRGEMWLPVVPTTA